jgi:hypothetical protein
MKLSKLFDVRIIFAISIFILPCFAYSQSGNIEESDDEYYIYDMVEPNSLQIDGDFYLEVYKMNAGQNLKNIKVDLKFFNAPQITLRFGIVRNLEVQLYTGYTGVITKGNVNIRILNKSLITANKDLTGLNPLGFGIKAGLVTNKKLRPSIAINGILTLPSVGIPAFRPDNPGAEVYFNFYNQLSEKFDIVYDAEIIWSGFSSDPYRSYYLAVSPGYFFSDKISLSLNYMAITIENFRRKTGMV